MIKVLILDRCEFCDCVAHIFDCQDVDTRGETYRPLVSPEHLRRLWKMKQASVKPITFLVAEALDTCFINAVVQS